MPVDGARVVFECAAQTDQRFGDGATRVYLEYPEALATRACGERGTASGPACLHASRLVLTAGASAEPAAQRVHAVFAGETRGLRERPADDNIRLGVRAQSASTLREQKSAVARAVRERFELGGVADDGPAVELTVYAEQALPRELEAQAARDAGGWGYLDLDRLVIERSLAQPFLAAYGFPADGASAAFVAFDHRCAAAQAETLSRLVRLREAQVQARARSLARGG